jgi:hypothetical protein
MTKAILIVKHKDSRKWDAGGHREFIVVPRIGEHVELNIDGVGCLYKVVSVHHPVEVTGMIDIVAVYAGQTIDLMVQLRETL